VDTKFLSLALNNSVYKNSFRNPRYKRNLHKIGSSTHDKNQLYCNTFLSDVPEGTCTVIHTAGQNTTCFLGQNFHADGCKARIRGKSRTSQTSWESSLAVRGPKPKLQPNFSCHKRPQTKITAKPRWKISLKLKVEACLYNLVQ